ncbi:ABC transporter ATP-binding protein YtrB [Streptococcus intermedius]|uniref:ATP-binding cassette domain-containing protein n=1 Tax=Streptococcus intermedius TaxID=1338 RepID=UPI000F6602A3|nr:ABC transporter ATP-binding protein [Streptococcus intermedius]RSJ17249.1 ABC transporter ATP-binding protein YtrB [Streptococcus intermedius]
MLKIEHGFKTYKGNIVLNDIHLTFENHHIYGLVGINGSGKTLILKALAGYIKLDKGTVYQDNIQIRKRKNYIERAGVLIENPEFISHLSLLENLELVKQLCRHKKEIDLSYWISLYGLEKFTHTAYKNLSLGTKKKMALIQAFIDSPEILILDEPMNALDEKSVAVTQDLILKQKQKGLVVLSSHLASDIDNLCDVVYRIQEGKVV